MVGKTIARVGSVWLFVWSPCCRLVKPAYEANRTNYNTNNSSNYWYNILNEIVPFTCIHIMYICVSFESNTVGPTLIVREEWECANINNDENRALPNFQVKVCIWIIFALPFGCNLILSTFATHTTCTLPRIVSWFATKRILCFQCVPNSTHMFTR